MTKHQTLGDSVIPINYKLSIEPDFRTFRFSGECSIGVRIRKRTSTVLLNAKELKIRSVSVLSGSKKIRCTFSLDKKLERISIKTEEPVSGAATLQISYQGVHNDKLYGFYRSKYNAGKKSGYIMTTQFEAPDARAAFPCFDEPAFKATFDLSLLVDKDMVALSNMPRKSVKNAGTKKLVIFHTTPRMSTYLLYIGVGRFEATGDATGRVRVHVITTPGKKGLGKIALDYGKRLLAAEEKYFGIDFPLPKLDLIAIPDFAAGAMENWGAITFREYGFLTDAKEASAGVKQRICEVIAHELVHQWFGDLVTMEWWDDIWLNESFATFMSYKIADTVLPELKMLMGYYEQRFPSAFGADAFKSTHPISMRVDTPDEINSMFDMVSYSKGSTVLNMLEDFVGADAFRRGLHRYLISHKYGNASRDDLWGAVQKEARGKPVSKVMQAWITSPGYPIINIEKSAGGFVLTQKRYTLLDYKLPGVWPIPLHYLSEEGERKILMKGKTLKIKTSGDWIKLNAGQNTLYKVSYPESVLEKLGMMIRDGRLAPLDAWGVENDLFSGVRTGRTTVKRYLSFVNSYLLGADYPLSFSVSGHLSWLYTMGFGEPFAEAVKKTIIRFNRRLLDKVGISAKKGEGVTEPRTRALAIASLGMADDERIVRWAEESFRSYVNGRGAIDPNLKGAVFSIMAQHNPTQEVFDRLLGMYSNSRLPEDSLRAVAALGDFRDIPFLKKTLSASMDTKRVRMQDSLYPLIGALANPHARGMAWPWLKANWHRLMEFYPSGPHMLANVVSSLAVVRDISTKEDIERFFSNKANMRADIDRELKIALEKISANAKFVSANLRNV